MNNFEFITKIGSWSYCTVYKVFDHSKKVYKSVKSFEELHLACKLKEGNWGPNSFSI